MINSSYLLIFTSFLYRESMLLTWMYRAKTCSQSCEISSFKSKYTFCTNNACIYIKHQCVTTLSKPCFG